MELRVASRTRRLAAAVVAFCLCGCLGMKVDESALRDRAGADEPGVVVLTPEVVAQLVAQERVRGAKAHPDPISATAVAEYRIAPYDILGVTVWDHPELTIPAGAFRTAEATGNPVQADGNLFYPYAGEVKVAGLTVAQVRELLTKRLSRVIENPQLDVRVVAFRGRRIHVTGEVRAPTAVPLGDVPLRVQDALAAARELTPEADLSRVTLTRGGAVHQLDLQALYERGDASQNWLLQDGDVLHVPDRSRNRVFVLGEVRRQQSRLMVKGRMTLAEALGDVDGIDQATTNGMIYLIRGVYEKPEVFRLDASSPEAFLLATQLPLRPADVVFVSASDLTRWSRVMEQVLPTIRALTGGLSEVSTTTRAFQ